MVEKKLIRSLPLFLPASVQCRRKWAGSLGINRALANCFAFFASLPPLREIVRGRLNLIRGTRSTSSFRSRKDGKEAKNAKQAAFFAVCLFEAFSGGAIEDEVSNRSQIFGRLLY